jgi:hypothetical protein
MPYTPTQDGTQAFGIPDSPITINSVAYILEEININAGSTVVEIKGQNGVPIGQTFIPENMTGTGRLQLATSSTARPTRGQTFTLEGATWYVESVGAVKTQGAYQSVALAFRMQINA